MTTQLRAAIILATTLAYAILRYVICHDVAWANVPIYIVNKAVAWTGIILFALSISSQDKLRRREYGVLASSAIMTHLIMSLMILNPSYFGKFYGENGRMTALAEISMLAGVLGQMVLGGLFVANMGGNGEKRSSLRVGWGRAVLWCTAIHVAAMGVTGWLAPGTWYGYLPPISLLSFIVAVHALIQRGRRR